MCSPTAGRVVNGIATLGLSEAVRPMLGGGNKDLLDNAGSFGLAPMFAAQQNSQQPRQQQQANIPGTNMVAGSQPRQIT